MRLSLALKTLLRSPVRTLLTFVLLGTVTFMFVSKTAEYAATAREMDNAAKRYTLVAAVESKPARKTNPASPEYINADPRMAQRRSEKQNWIYNNNLRYRPLTEEQTAAISKLPYVMATDKRYMTAGVSDKYYRLDDGIYYYNYTSRCVIEATLLGIGLGLNNATNNHAAFEDRRVLLSNYPYASDTMRRMLHVSAYPGDLTKKNYTNPVDLSTDNQRQMGYYTSNYIYGTEYMNSMQPGSRYVFVARYDPLNKEPELTLYDHLTEPWCASIQLVDGEPEDYINTEKFAPLRTLIEITESDQHTFDVVYTDDMDDIMRFADNRMAIADGRMLTREDSAKGLDVCVVSSDFAIINRLKIGDAITLGLGTEMFEQYRGIGAVAVTPERYRPPEKEVTLKIVGIYIDTDSAIIQRREPNWGYSINTVFVPKSLLPVDESQLAGHELTPAEFSFMVSAWDIEAFLEKTAPIIKNMGLTLRYVDRGWSGIAREFETSKRLTLVQIAVFSCAVAAAIGLSVYLFIGRKKKEYAVMRALGTTKKASARALLIPLMTVAAAALALGTCAAWIYAARTIENSAMLAVIERYDVNVAVPAGIVVVCVLGELLLIYVIAQAILKRLSSLSPLALLHSAAGEDRWQRTEERGQRKEERGLSAAGVGAFQGKEDRGKRTEVSGLRAADVVALRGKEDRELSAADVGALRGINPDARLAAVRAPSVIAASEAQSPAGFRTIIAGHHRVRRGRSFGFARFAMQYAMRHIRRTARRAALSLFVAMLLFCAVGQLALTRQSYVNLSKDTGITANFTRGFRLSALPELLVTGLVKDLYYERGPLQVEIMNSSKIDSPYGNVISINVFITNNIARCIGEDADIAFAEGYDASCMDRFDNILILNESQLTALDLNLGDTVEVAPNVCLSVLMSKYVLEAQKSEKYYYRPNMDHSFYATGAIEMYGDQVQKEYRQAVRPFTIAGVTSSLKGAFEAVAFAPGVDGTQVLSVNTTMQVAEFTLGDNDCEDEMRNYAETVAARTSAIFSMDTRKIENLRVTLRILDTLFPVAVAAAMLIGAFLCCLAVLQSSKEASIMRVLGTTKSKTRSMLSLEQVLLGAAGLAVGVCAMLIYKGRELSVVANRAALFAALYVAAILLSSAICSTLVTRRSALELLQTKE